MKLSSWARRQGVHYSTVQRIRLGRRLRWEIGSGLNGHRPKLMKLLADPSIHTIIVEHRDRLMPFGVEYVEAALRAHGRRLMVVDPGEVRDDLVEDMMAVLTSLCARLYGRRSAKNKARKALQAVQP